MAVEIYILGKNDIPVFNMNDLDFKLLESVLGKFEQKTSVYLDMYSTTRLYYDHIQLLLKLIDEFIKSENRIKNMDRLIEIFTFLSSLPIDTCLIFEGD